MAGTEQIDVEALLVRAYREKQVHRLGRGNGKGEAGAERLLKRLIGLPALSGGGGGGEVVDTSCYGSRIIARQNEAMRALAGASDALLDLHDHVLALPDFFVERAGGDGVEFLVWDHATALRLGHVIRTEAAGASIVKTRRRGGEGERADDRVPTAPPRPVSRVVTSALVVRHGCDADRPYVPDLVVTGMRPVYQNGRREHVVGHTPIYETDPSQVALDRAIHAVWHTALSILAWECAGLSGYAVSGPLAPAAPWEDEPAPAVVIHRRAAPVRRAPMPAHLTEWPKAKRPRKPAAKAAR